MFHVGQMVVCVNDNPSNSYHNPPLAMPRAGQIYTIRSLSDENSLTVEEIFNSPRWVKAEDGRIIWDEPHFWNNRFRPVRATSIDVFTSMLAPTPKERVTV